MTVISALQFASGLSVLSTSAASRTTGPTTTNPDSDSAPINPASPNKAANATGHAALVASLQSQDPYAEVWARAKADDIAVKNIPQYALDMLKAHLSDMPDLVEAFRSTSQVDAIIEQNRTMSSSAMSDALYNDGGLKGLGFQPDSFQSMVDSLKTGISGLADQGYTMRAASQSSALSDMETAFANKTLSIENAYTIPGLMQDDGGGFKYTGPPDGVPTGFSGSTIDQVGYSKTADGMNHYIYQTVSGAAVYFSWSDP